VPKSAIERLEQRTQTRSKLIDAAVQLFSTSGYEHATVDDISQAAGYSKGAYYFHFSTKDDILLELLRLWAEGRSEIVASVEGDQSPAEAVPAMLERFFSYAEAPRWPAILLEFWSQATRNVEVSKRLTATYSSWRRQIGDALAEAQRDGLQIASADDAASVMLAAHDGYAVQLAIGATTSQALSARELVASLLAPAAAEAASERAVI